MINLDAISKIPLEDLEAKLDVIFQELNMDSHRIPPLAVLETLKNGPINIASNGMIYILLHTIVNNRTWVTWEFDETSQWLDHDTIKGWIVILKTPIRYVFFLTEEQTTIMRDVKNANIKYPYAEGEDVFRNFIISLDGVLKDTALTDEEKTHPLAAPYVIPENSGSLSVAEETSRFSGASWFNAIQKKTIILAGLGGIGRFGNLVNF